MTKLSFAVIALAIAVGTATAQPGATPPTEPPPYAPPAEGAPPNGDPGTMPPGETPPSAQSVDLDAMLAKVAAEAPTLETVARGTFRRARRAISVGPTLGVWSGAFTAHSEFETALSFGLGVQTFKVPVLPGPATLQALVIERVKAKLKDQVLARFAGRQPEPLELEAMAKSIYEEVRREILGLENVRPKTFERPRYGIGIEANYLFGAERWFARMRASIGVWKFSLGLSLSAGCLGGPCGDRLELYGGPELTVHALMSRNPRASVLDMFFRVDLQATGRDELDPYDQVVLGLRYLLDVF